MPPKKARTTTDRGPPKNLDALKHPGLQHLGQRVASYLSAPYGFQDLDYYGRVVKSKQKAKDDTDAFNAARDFGVPIQPYSYHAASLPHAKQEYTDAKNQYKDLHKNTYSWLWDDSKNIDMAMHSEASSQMQGKIPFPSDIPLWVTQTAREAITEVHSNLP